MQVATYIYSALGGACIILTCRPYEDNTLNIVEVINELFVLACSYIALLYCNLVTDYQIRDNLGSTQYYAIITITGVNVVIAITTICHRQWQRYQRRKEFDEFLKRIEQMRKEEQELKEQQEKVRIANMQRLQRINIMNLKVDDESSDSSSSSSDSEENVVNIDIEDQEIKKTSKKEVEPEVEEPKPTIISIFKPKPPPKGMSITEMSALKAKQALKKDKKAPFGGLTTIPEVAESGRKLDANERIAMVNQEMRALLRR